MVATGTRPICATSIIVARSSYVNFHPQPRVVPRWDQGSRQALQERGPDGDPVPVADLKAVLALLKPLPQLSDWAEVARANGTLPWR